MLYREESNSLIVITQPAHAWVSGQLARAWGNAAFGRVEPREAVCLGAEQHDLGWVGWEQNPTRHPTSGRPRRFFELPTAEHVAIWRGASRRALTQGRYAALLVSLHVAGLYERHDYSQDTPEEARDTRAFLASERAFQDEILAGLRGDPRYVSLSSEAVVRRNQRLVAVWDRLSLMLCAGLQSPQTVDRVPTANSETTLQVTPSDGELARVAVEPWPFQEHTATIRYDARRLAPASFADEAALREALARAPWLSGETQLIPA